MKYRNIILSVVVLGLVVVLSGCGECCRQASSNRKFERVLEQASIEAVNESIQQGQLRYAIRVLEELIESESAFSEQAGQIRDELKKAMQLIAQARIDSELADG